MRVLVTGVGGPAGRHVSQLLCQGGHKVIGVDMQLVTLSGLAAFYQAPPARDPTYVDWLAQTAVTADLIIPTVQEELTIIAAAQDKLPCPVLIAPALPVSVAHDKYQTAQALAVSGVPVPEFVRPADLHSAADVATMVGWPCLSKPRVGRGGRGVTVYDSPADFPALAALDEDYIVQAFAPGAEYAVNLYVNGVATVVVVLEKTALREGRTGNAARVRRVDAPDVAVTAVAAARALGLTGPLDIDIRRRADGCPLVLEINARFGANIAHAPEVLAIALA
ncbi:MAG: ATP-grasp domain-containing protein [Chloroflexi bacterium]|nr:ATP-grasp domain-containing protein [Chloroflexota bacterium]